MAPSSPPLITSPSGSVSSWTAFVWAVGTILVSAQASVGCDLPDFWLTSSCSQALFSLGVTCMLLVKGIIELDLRIVEVRLKLFESRLDTRRKDDKDVLERREDYRKHFEFALNHPTCGRSLSCLPVPVLIPSFGIQCNSSTCP